MCVKKQFISANCKPGLRNKGSKDYDLEAKMLLRFSLARPTALQAASVLASAFSITKSCIVPQVSNGCNIYPAWTSLLAYASHSSGSTSFSSMMIKAGGCLSAVQQRPVTEMLLAAFVLFHRANSCP
jgi:hypothetical protein